MSKEEQEQIIIIIIIIIIPKTTTLSLDDKIIESILRAATQDQNLFL